MYWRRELRRFAMKRRIRELIFTSRYVELTDGLIQINRVEKVCNEEKDQRADLYIKVC